MVGRSQMFFRVSVFALLVIGTFVLCQYSQPRVSLKQGVVAGVSKLQNSGPS